MIIDYDHNPNVTDEQMLQSLKESVQMALNEIDAELDELRKLLRRLQEQND